MIPRLIANALATGMTNERWRSKARNRCETAIFLYLILAIGGLLKAVTARVAAEATAFESMVQWKRPISQPKNRLPGMESCPNLGLVEYAGLSQKLHASSIINEMEMY